MEQLDLVRAATGGVLGGGPAVNEVSGEDLSALFGIELDGGPDAEVVEPASRRRSAPESKRPTASAAKRMSAGATEVEVVKAPKVKRAKADGLKVKQGREVRALTSADYQALLDAPAVEPKKPRRAAKKTRG